MTLKRFATMTRAGALAALFVVGTSAAAIAAPIVTFYTEGRFGSTNTNEVMFTDVDGGTATVTFNGIPELDPNSHDMDPFGISNTSYGDFLLATSGLFVGEVDDTFTLDIFQSSPEDGTNSFLGQLTGNFVRVTETSSVTNFRVTFDDTTLTIDGVTYTVDPLILLTPPLAGAGGGAAPGISSVEGTVSAQPTVVPEPATMMLLGTGLLAAFRARRRLGMQNDR